MAETFKPIRGSQTAINRYPIVEGQVLFAYDSGRIYLDKNGVRYVMSSKSSGGGGAGGTGIIYANGLNTQIIPEDLSEHEPVNFLMDLAALEDPVPPEIDNLILNSDGRFFRVIGYDEATEKISVKLLAVSGSGGGGGGGSSSAEPDVNITWDGDTISTGRIYIYKQDYNAVFIPTTTAPGDINCNVTFNVIDNINGTTETIVRNNMPSGVPFNFDTSILPESSNITLQIIVTSDNSQYNYGLGYQRNITGLRVVRMELEKPTSGAYQALVKGDNLAGTLTLKYRPIGDSSLSFTLHTYVDDTEIGIGTAIPTSYLNQIVPITIDRQSHGVHKISLTMSTNIGGTTVYSNTIEYEGAWATSGKETPIIWIGGYDKTVINYENSYIYYMVFDPVNYANGMPAEVHLYKDGIEVSQIDANYSDDDWLVWDISNLYTIDPTLSDDEPTVNNFAIVCGSERVNILVNVTKKGSRELGLIYPNNLILNMSTAGRSSNEIKRNRTKFESTVNTNNITATLNNFNWQNNGWRDSDGPNSQGVDSGAYLSIANGAELSIAQAGNGLLLNGDRDYSFELRFRVTNIQEYSTLVRTIPKYFYMVPSEDVEGEWRPTYSAFINNDGDEVYSGPSLFEEEIIAAGYKIGVDQYGNLLMDEKNSFKTVETEKGVVLKWLNNDNYGFCIGTQEAFFKTPSGVANVRYCEDEVINIAMVVSKTDKVCYVYLNGILSGAADLPSGTGASFTVNSPFVFNSKYCDFDLYRFRIYYDLGLSMPQVIHNYLSDMHSIKLYDENQLTDPLDATALSYTELVKYNENHPENVTMPYATWQITDGTDEKLSYKKGNNRAATVEFVNPPLDQALKNGDITPWLYYTHSPSFVADKVDLNVQGTSSQKYPRRNYKLKYKSAKDTWKYTQGPLAGYPLTKDYYFYKANGELVTVEQLNEETQEIEIVPLTDKNQYNSTTMQKLTKKFHMDTETFGTNKFTWKIDFMESSGTYNTGFANLMGNLVHPLYTKHPLDDYNLGINTSDMRTSIYGFPVLTFHKYSDGRYEYIGRYNMNLDKGSNEYFGFEDETLQPYVPTRIKKVLNSTTNEYEEVEYQPTVAEIAECWELKDNQGTWCSFKYPDAASRRTGFMTLKEGTSGNSAQLEILNHYEYRYSFYADELDAAYEYTAFTDTNTQEKYTNNGQINQYLYEKHKNLETVFNWLDSTNPDSATNTTFAQPIIYNTASYNSDDDSVNYEIILNDAQVIIPGSEEAVYDPEKTYYIRKNNNYWFYEYDADNWSDDISNGAVYTATFSGLYKATFTKDTREYRKQKFYAELEQHFDKEYCLTYYVLTELLLCYDSRGKNLMMATFGPQRAGGEYIWYPIFYDVDTQLGLNNSGAYLWDYDADVTKENIFSTPTSVLWNNLYDVYYNDIVQKYRVLRGVSNPSSADEEINGSLTYENIVGAYECNPNVFNSYAMRGARPIIAIGLDEYYKYLAPALTEQDYNNGKLYAGYYDTQGSHLYQNEITYAYCAQGDKKLTTELLLRNRLNYIDSWWLGGDYRAGVVENQIFIRANANQHDTSDLILDSETVSSLTGDQISQGYTLKQYPQEYFDARPGAKIKPFLHQYVSYFMDSQPSVPIKYDGSSGQEDGVWTNVDTAKLMAFKGTPDLTQQITYIPGGDYISSLGDISLMYPNSLQIFHGQRMLDFKLGSDIPGYSNPLINASSDWSLATMPLLKSVNISKLQDFSRELNLTGSSKLQEFRALGSIIERINFAAGAPLHTVHLPNTMTTLSLVQHQDLKNILTSVPVVVVEDSNQPGHYIYQDPDTYRGLYVEGVTDYVSGSAGHNISTYEVQGGGLGYNSYIILRNLYNMKKDASAKNTLSIGLTDVEWTPYVVVEKGTVYDSNETYYLLNDHSTYEIYSYSNVDTWNEQLNNGLIFTYNEEYLNTNAEETITSLELLDALIDQYLLAAQNEETSQFSNLVNTTEATIPTITGSLYVSNDSSHKIKETDLTSVYAQYFPYLAISAKYVQESNVTKYVRYYEDTGIIETIEALRSDTDHPLAPTKNAPTKAGYDFIGWSTDVEGNNMFLSYQVDINTGNGSYINQQNSLNNYSFTANNTSVITLYAQFTVHKNYITIYNGSERVGAAIVDNGSMFVNPDYIYDYTDGQIDITKGHAYEPYKDDSGLELLKTYKFVGYSTLASDTTSITAGKEVPIIVSNNMTIYSVFEEDSVYNNILDDKYLTFSSDDNTAMIFNSNTISAIRGKVTLPLTLQGREVLSFGTNSTEIRDAASHITHIFWQLPTDLVQCKVEAYNNSAFNGWNNLLYVEIPENETGTFVINTRCFELAKNLFNNAKITAKHKQEFFERITALGESCFANIGTQSENTGIKFIADCEIRLNANMSRISDGVFYRSPVKKVIFGDPKNGFGINPSNLGANIFKDSGYGESFRTAGRHTYPSVIYYYPTNLYNGSYLNAASLSQTISDKINPATLEDAIEERPSQEEDND